VTEKDTRTDFVRNYRAGSFMAQVLLRVAPDIAEALSGKLREVAASFLRTCATEAARHDAVPSDAPLLHGQLFDLFSSQLALLEPDARLLEVDPRTRENVRNQLHRVVSLLRDYDFDITHEPMARCTYRFRIPEVRKGGREEIYEVFLDTTVHIGAPEDVVRVFALGHLYTALPAHYLEDWIPLDLLGAEHVPLLHALTDDPTLENFVRLMALLQTVVDRLWPVERWHFLNELFELDVPEEVGVRLANFDWAYMFTAYEEVVEFQEVVVGLHATRCLTLVEKLVALDVARQVGTAAIADLTQMLFATVTDESHLLRISLADAVQFAVQTFDARAEADVAGVQRLQEQMRLNIAPHRPPKGSSTDSR
jgi:hypothetical protein